jgi:hypothetical protein
LYQLLSGTKPFEGRPLAKLLSAISQTPHVPLQQRAPAVPKSVSDLVDRLLSKPREGRPASAGLVRDELRAILGRESSSATKAMLAQEGYEETVFVVTPAKPPAPGETPAARAAATPPTERPPSRETAPPGHMTATKADEPAPQSGRTVATPALTAVFPPPLPSAPVAPTIEPPPPLPAVPPASESAVRSAVVRPAAVAPAVSSVAMPGKKKTSRLLVAAIVVAVAGTFVLAGLSGAAWWWWNSRQQGSVADGAREGPPAAIASVPPAAAPAQAATAPASQPQAPPPALNTAPETPVPQVATPVEPAPTRGQAAPPPGAMSVTPVPPSARPPTTPSVPLPMPPAAGELPRQPAAAAPSQKPTAASSAQPPIETGVTTGAGARPGVTQNTVESFSGRQPGQAYDADTAASAQATVSRINYVLEQYVRALVNADAGAIREYRSALSPEENALMRAQQLKVRLEDVRVEVNGAEATARCRRKVAGTSASGAPLQEDVVGVYRLVRKPTGWVITDVK